MNLIENHTEFLIIEIHHYVFIIFSDRFADNGIEKPFIILMKQQVYFVINRQMFDETIVKGFFKRSVLVEQEQDIGHLTRSRKSRKALKTVSRDTPYSALN